MDTVLQKRGQEIGWKESFMNKRMKKKWDKRVERVYVHNFERAYIVSLFEKLLDVYTDENQRWHPDGAYIAARLYTKKLLKRIRRSTIHTTLKRDVNHILMSCTNIMRTPGKMEIKNLRIERTLEPFRNSAYKAMMDHSKQREELKKKLLIDPELNALAKALDRDTELLNSPDSLKGSQHLYAETDEFTEDPVVMSRSTAESYLNGTVDGLVNYHAAVAGNEPNILFMDKLENCIKFEEDEEKLKAISKELIDLSQGARWECDEHGNPKRLISIDLCHNDQ